MTRLALSRRSLFAASLSAAVPLVVKPHAKPLAALWAVSDGEKVDADDLANPHKRRNSAWDGHTARTFGARNEVVAFQLVAEAGAAGIGALSVRLPILRQVGGPGVIRYAPPVADPTDTVGRQIQVFSERYMTIAERSNADWIYLRDSPAEPPDPLGPKPVQLVPENAAQGGFPLAVPAARNQAFWFDIYIPRRAPAGVYRGRIEVRADDQVRMVPVELTVFPFTLPDENSINAMFYFESSQVELRYGRNLDPVFHRFAHRHRVEFVDAYDIATATAARSRFTGTDFTKANGYEGPGEGVGNTLIPRTFYGPEPDFDTLEKAKANAPLWTDWLSKNLPGKRTFVYMPDEPSAEDYDYIRSLSSAVRASGAPLPIFTTHAYDAALDGPNKAIDIWATVADLYDSKAAATLRKDGRDMWFYNGQRPNVGSVVIESPATDPRANLWAAFKHNVSTYFYWHTNHWRHNRQVLPGRERNQNVWLDPVTFYNKRGWWANGDGVLMYPGEDLIYPDQDRGIAGPISTIQLANFRRGIQDHLYLTMARNLGLHHLVDQTVDQIVPAVLDEAGPSVSYPQQANPYEQARLKLAQSIAARS
ncbi:hypothetical protein GCM10009554_65660 [Kribbella koreensis]|uniref:Glycoside hydrolase 123 catalytic domain-containing protein n=1 Tax=Kribbella koreensis TaxID=57909 RepID=A0ABN1RFP7_9ACTN